MVCASNSGSSRQTQVGTSSTAFQRSAIWTTGRLSVYFLCGNANKIYLEALWRRHAVLRPCLAENACEWKMPVENDCPDIPGGGGVSVNIRRHLHSHHKTITLGSSCQARTKAVLSQGSGGLARWAEAEGRKTEGVRKIPCGDVAGICRFLFLLAVCRTVTITVTYF